MPAGPSRQTSSVGQGALAAKASGGEASASTLRPADPRPHGGRSAAAREGVGIKAASKAFCQAFPKLGCFVQAFPKIPLAVLWDFKGLQGKKPTRSLSKFFRPVSL